MELTDRFIETIRAEFPTFRIVPKRGHWPSRAIDLALKALTFGGQRSYLSRYHTVIGNILYVPPTWEAMSDLDRVILLRHERVHLRQRRRYGAVLMTWLYLMPFFPARPGLRPSAHRMGGVRRDAARDRRTLGSRGRPFAQPTLTHRAALHRTRVRLDVAIPALGPSLVRPGAREPLRDR